MSQSAVSTEQTAAPLGSQAGRSAPTAATSTVRESSYCSTDVAWKQLLGEFEFVAPNMCCGNLAARTKEEAIRALVAAMTAAGAIAADDCQSVTLAVLRREELGTTGIGEAVAIPHTKHAAVKHVVGAIGYSPTGIDFNSVDDRPVHLVFLLLSPVGVSRDHLLALEAVVRRVSAPAYAGLRAGRRDD